MYDMRETKLLSKNIHNSSIWKWIYSATEIVKQNAEHGKHSQQGLHWMAITSPSLPFPVVTFIISSIELNLAPNQVKRQASQQSSLLTRKTKKAKTVRNVNMAMFSTNQSVFHLFKDYTNTFIYVKMKRHNIDI